MGALYHSEIKRVVRFGLDMLLSIISFVITIAFIFNESALPKDNKLFTISIIFAVSCAAVYCATGLSFRSWRFVSLPDVIQLNRDIAIAVLVFMFLSSSLQYSFILPPSAPIIAYCAMLTSLGGVRVLYRAFHEGRLPFRPRNVVPPDDLVHQPENLIVYGATPATDGFLRTVQSFPGRPYRVVGILDDERSSRDRSIQGVRVLGGCDKLPDILNSLRQSSLRVSALVVPTVRISRAQIGAIVDAANKVGLRTVRLPDTRGVLSANHQKVEFEPIKVTELLGREPVSLRLGSIENLIKGKSVVVTGGGGSIGSELCRQLLRRNPRKLVILDHSEFALYNIERELAPSDPNHVVQPILASVRDRETIFSILKETSAQLVFHAAAYKHVPLVEANPVEGVLTNFLGTTNVVDAASFVGAEAMIMVSTDKAVKPHCTMGLSKRVAETYCQAMDAHCAFKGRSTRFMVVRFGNVLGSSGSIVPLFEQQIKNGGPVTVTDPNMTRYFMTIPEAVGLVLQGSSFALEQRDTTGAVMVLDMGEPVPIVELARRMIALAGYVPDRDIHISYVGIREGEKLHEELFDDNEVVETADIEGIRLARSPVQQLARMRRLRDRVATASLPKDADRVIEMLRDALSAARTRDRAAYSRMRPNAEGAIHPINLERALREKSDSAFSQRAFAVESAASPVSNEKAPTVAQPKELTEETKKRQSSRSISRHAQKPRLAWSLDQGSAGDKRRAALLNKPKKPIVKNGRPPTRAASYDQPHGYN